MKDKQKPKDWKITKFLKEKAPNLAGEVLDLAGDLTGIKLLSKIGDNINKSNELTPKDKELALKQLEMDAKEMLEVSNRWKYDMTSDSWLSKNVRPLTLVYLLVIMTILVIGDSVENSFKVNEGWVKLVESLLITVVVAYFGSRGFEKYSKIKK